MNIHPKSAQVRDRMVPRSEKTGAKLPSRAGDRYLVKRNRFLGWSHTSTSEIPKLLEDKVQLGIWEDKAGTRRGKDGKIQGREITRIHGGAANLLDDLNEVRSVLDREKLGHSVSLAAPANEHAEDSFHDIMGEVGNAGYDAEHYTLRIIPDFEEKTILGHTTLQAEATQDLESFSLDFMPFSELAVEVNGESAKVLQEKNELRVFPKDPIKDGEDFEVDVLYEGAPHEVREEFVFNLPFGLRFVDGALSAVSEPRSARGWFPGNDHPSDKATFDIQVSVPEGYEAQASGLLESAEPVGNGQSIQMSYKPKDPMATYLVALNAFKTEDYDIWQQESPSGVPIENSIPKDSKPITKETLNKSPEMLSYLEDFLGEYPFEVLGNHTFRGLFGGAFEAQTRNVYTHNLMEHEHLGPIDRSVHWPTEVLAHETAHQWFGDAVSLNRWKDIWVKEAFATYFGAAYAAKEFGVDIDEHMSARYEASRERVSGYIPGEPNAKKMYSGDAYNLMAGSVHALRKELGEADFKNVLKTFLKEYNGESAEVTDFVAVAEQVSGKELNDFFNRWVYTEHLPKRLPK